MESKKRLPLDERFLDQSEPECFKTRSSQGIPALDRRWKKHRQYIMYHSPPSSNNNEADEEEWIEIAKYVIDDFEWLLSISHQQFWVQIIYDEKCHRLIESFLSNSPKPYDNYNYGNENVKKLQDRITELAFKVCLRFSTHKESNEDFITPNIFGKILYDNFIWDMPKIFDFCSIYAPTNGPLVNKVIHCIFNNQKLYMHDLKGSFNGMEKAFERVTKEIFGSENEPCPLSVNLDDEKLDDVVHYLLDCSKNLEYFICSYEESAIELFKNSFHFKIADFYSNVLNSLTKYITSNDKDESVLDKLTLTKFTFVEVFRLIIFHGNLKNLEDESKLNKKTARATIEMFQTILEKNDFAREYCVLYDFCTDSPLLWKYLQNNLVHEKELEYLTCEFESLAPPSRSASENLPNSDTVTSGNLAENVCLGAEGIDLTSSIAKVKEFSPHLKEDFIREQLKIYDYDAEKLIHAVLDGIVVQPEDKHKDKFESINVPENIRERANIYDGDEFDIFARNDIDVNKIHQGKKDYSVTLKDQEASQATKNFVAMYEVDAGEPIENEYDDEYDDTYDAQDVGVQDNDSEIEMQRPFVTPRVLTTNERPAKVQEKSDEETEEGTFKNRLNFCEDPSVLRERAAERRASQMKHRHNYHPRENSQPQSKEKTLKDRSWKDKHKSSQGNHNRRVLADKKRKF